MSRSSDHQRSYSVPPGWPNRVAIILTAIDAEFRAVCEHLRDVKEVVHPRGTVYKVGIFGTRTGAWTIAVVETGQGNDTAALEAERAIQYFDATHALFVGVAGGLKDVRLGDVVAATKVYGYESGKDVGEFLPRPDVGESSYDLVMRARAVSKQPQWAPASASAEVGDKVMPRAFVGPIAAGSKLVASQESATAALLRRNYGDALAVEMEGRGFLRALHASPGLRSLVVRGISDLLSGKTESDEKGWQEIAARNAASFAFAVLAGLLDTSLSADDESSASQQVQPRAPEKKPRLGEPANQARRLVDMLCLLYPIGPTDNHIWQRAGGDLASLKLEGNGRSRWYEAIVKVQQGARPTLADLLKVALEEYPDNLTIPALLEEVFNVGES